MKSFIHNDLQAAFFHPDKNELSALRVCEAHCIPDNKMMSDG